MNADEAKLREALAPYTASNVTGDFCASTRVSNSTLPSVDEVKFWPLRRFIENLSLEHPCAFNVDVFQSSVGTKTMKEAEGPLNVVREKTRISFGSGHTIEASCTLWTRRCRIMPPPEVQPSKPVQPAKRRKRGNPQTESAPLKTTSGRWNYRYEAGVHMENIRLNEIKIDDINYSFHLQRKNAINDTASHSVEPTWYEIVRQLQNQVQVWPISTVPLSLAEHTRPVTQAACVSPAKVPTLAEASTMITTQRKNDCLTPDHIGDSPPGGPVPKVSQPLPLTPPDPCSKTNASRLTQVQRSRGNGMQKQLGLSNMVASQTHYMEQAYPVQPKDVLPSEPRLSHHPRQPEFVATSANLQQQGASAAFVQPSINKSCAPANIHGAVSQGIPDVAYQGMQPQQATYMRNYHPAAAGSHSAAPSFRTPAGRQQSQQQIPSSRFHLHLQQQVSAEYAAPNTMPLAPNQTYGVSGRQNDGNIEVMDSIWTSSPGPVLSDTGIQPPVFNEGPQPSSFEHL
jgi:hypothetical protein